MHLTNGLNGKWKMCEKTNSTYLDCPISQFDLTEGAEFYFSVHNPSSLKMNVAEISVPHGNFEVREYIWDDQTKKGQYQEVTGADVHCYRDYNLTGDDIQNCAMFIKTSIEPRDINLYKLVVNT
jgi:hypothetical protein